MALNGTELSSEVSIMMKQWLSEVISRCHVGDDYGTVRRYVVSRFKYSHKTFHGLPRATRRLILMTIYREHKANRKLYRYVMGGL